VVQLREKLSTTAEFVALGRLVQEVLAPFGVPLLINDRVDVALAVGAQGVHLGQEDMRVSDARKLLGPEAIIGLSVETMDQVREAETLDVDYLGVSPVYTTPTKPEAANAWGLDGLGMVKATSRHPLVGIGSIGPHNAAEVIRAGAHGVAVVSAICAELDPQAATAKLRMAVDGALGLFHPVS
jgi:thiamine-phosphate pyrophosphorylase